MADAIFSFLDWRNLSILWYLKRTWMLKINLAIIFLLLPFISVFGQLEFQNSVALALGADQELVNGIQYSNNFIHIEGHPYFMDGKFRNGAVFTNNQEYDSIGIRYNLYTQKVEIMYLTAGGTLKFFMSVAELLPSFILDGKLFIRRQFPDEQPAYYQVIRSGQNMFYVGWVKKLRLSRNDRSREYQFSTPMISYWLELDQHLSTFHNRRSFLESFPASMRKALSRLLKQQHFSFKHASSKEVEELFRTALLLYQKGIVQ